MVRRRIRILINLFTAAMPFIAWVDMAMSAGGLLSSRGLVSLKDFTVLSNLLEGIASVVWLCVVLRGHRAMHRAEVLKLIAGQAVALTFLTVMAFLGPVFGYGGMFLGANFWFHLIIPVVAILEMLTVVREPYTRREAAIGVLPVLLYGLCYLGNILLNGRGDAATGWNDFYGFAAWGIPAGILIFGGICLVVFAVGLFYGRMAGRKGS